MRDVNVLSSLAVTAAALVASLGLGGCGVNQEEMKKETNAVRSAFADADRAVAEETTGKVEDMRKEITAVRVKAEQEDRNIEKRLDELGRKLDGLSGELGKIASVAHDIERLRADMTRTLEDTAKSYDRFQQESGAIQEKVKLAQEKYKEIIQNNIKSLREQYTYLSNLLASLEKGGEKPAPPGAGEAPPSGGGGK